MPSPVRAKKLMLLTKREGETEKTLWVIPTFRSAYSLALLEGRIAEPNLQERAARIQMRRTGWVWLWDKSQHEYEESAKWSPTGQMIKIEEVLVKK